MSLKLGDTDIAGTQILYSTTGNNTDGAMTQAITTTQLNLKANDADVVHKTGNETIAGTKTFADDIVINNNNFTGAMINLKSQAVSSLLLEIPGNTWASLNVQPNTTGMLLTSGDRSAFVPLYCGGSDTMNTAVTTAGISKAANGHFKLGNGLIVNWGTYGTGSGSATITYSMPYTSAPKIFAGNNYNSTGAFPGFTGVGTTSCTIHKNSGIGGWWFAIGY